MTEYGQDRTHQIRVLNGLIETTIDSVVGYRSAADAARSNRFSAAFQERAREREGIVERLRELVRRFDGTPQEGGSTRAGLHRAFMNLRDTITGDDDGAVLAEVDHGESYLRGKWEAALDDSELTGEARELVRECYDSIRRAQEQWRREHADLSATGTDAGGAFEAVGETAGGARSV